MQIEINDQRFDARAGEHLGQVLQRFCAHNDLAFAHIAVAQGDRVLPRSQWSQLSVNDAQPYTVFTAVAGG